MVFQEQVCLCRTLQHLQYVQLNNTAPSRFSRTRLGADRMLALDLRVLGFSIVSINIVVMLHGQSLTASIEFAGLTAKVTAVPCSSWKQMSFLRSTHQVFALDLLSFMGY